MAPDPMPSSEAGSLEAPHAEELPLQARAKGCAGPRETEPPEPSACKRCLPLSEEPGSDVSQVATPTLNTDGSPIRPNWLGRLFGATCPPARGFPADPDTSAAKSRSVPGGVRQGEPLQGFPLLQGSGMAHALHLWLGF